MQTCLPPSQGYGDGEAPVARPCEICGKPVPLSEGVPWLTGVVHQGCKMKEEKRMQGDSDTVYGKDQKPI